eukprot:GILI01006222.1.p1 GENE.GILI01006222.1~~GILI01006222.1.p1  ORF type:complete len:710 (+),score=180.88 GILI01006222.1:94-2223(+)
MPRPRFSHSLWAAAAFCMLFAIVVSPVEADSGCEKYTSCTSCLAHKVLQNDAFFIRTRCRWCFASNSCYSKTDPDAECKGHYASSTSGDSASIESVCRAAYAATDLVSMFSRPGAIAESREEPVVPSSSAQKEAFLPRSVPAGAVQRSGKSRVLPVADRSPYDFWPEDDEGWLNEQEEGEDPLDQEYIDFARKKARKDRLKRMGLPEEEAVSQTDGGDSDASVDMHRSYKSGLKHGLQSALSRGGKKKENRRVAFRDENEFVLIPHKEHNNEMLSGDRTFEAFVDRKPRKIPSVFEKRPDPEDSVSDIPLASDEPDTPRASSPSLEESDAEFDDAEREEMDASMASSEEEEISAPPAPAFFPSAVPHSARRSHFVVPSASISSTPVHLPKVTIDLNPLDYVAPRNVEMQSAVDEAKDVLAQILHHLLNEKTIKRDVLDPLNTRLADLTVSSLDLLASRKYSFDEMKLILTSQLARWRAASLFVSKVQASFFKFLIPGTRWTNEHLHHFMEETKDELESMLNFKASIDEQLHSLRRSKSSFFSTPKNVDDVIAEGESAKLQMVKKIQILHDKYSAMQDMMRQLRDFEDNVNNPIHLQAMAEKLDKVTKMVSRDYVRALLACQEELKSTVSEAEADRLRTEMGKLESEMLQSVEEENHIYNMEMVGIVTNLQDFAGARNFSDIFKVFQGYFNDIFSNLPRLMGQDRLFSHI